MDSSNKELLDSINELESGKTIGELKGLSIRVLKPLALTIKQLKAAVKAHPNHPVALACAKTISTLSDSKTVVMDRVDVQALIENKSVIEETKIEETNGSKRRCLTKKVGAVLSVPQVPKQGKTDTPKPLSK